MTHIILLFFGLCALASAFFVISVLYNIIKDIVKGFKKNSNGLLYDFKEQYKKYAANNPFEFALFVYMIATGFAVLAFVYLEKTGYVL